MPIRTNRGRAAVYRKLWGWPLRSPRHLAVAVFIAALVLTAAGIVVPKVVGTKGTTQVGAGGSSTTTTTTTRPGQIPDRGISTQVTTSPLPTRITSAPSPTTRESAPPQALEAVTKWAERWVDHPSGISGKDWLERLRPYTTEEYLGVMGSIDPANIKATRVTGTVRAETSYAKSVEAEVPTDAGPVHVTVIDTGQGWKVADYQQGSG